MTEIDFLRFQDRLARQRVCDSIHGAVVSLRHEIRHHRCVRAGLWSAGAVAILGGLFGGAYFIRYIRSRAKRDEVPPGIMARHKRRRRLVAMLTKLATGWAMQAAKQSLHNLLRSSVMAKSPSRDAERQVQHAWFPVQPAATT